MPSPPHDRISTMWNTNATQHSSSNVTLNNDTPSCLLQKRSNKPSVESRSLKHNSNNETNENATLRQDQYRVSTTRCMRNTVMIMTILALSLRATVTAEELPICQVSDEFLPELMHNTGSFGNMFEVRTKEYPVKITEIAFSTDLYTNVTYHAWSKTGTYENHEFYEESWTKIAQGWTMGLGKEQPTPIPADSFEGMWIDPQQTQAFLIMLETPDIRYNYGNFEGMAVEEHEDFLLLEGKGVASYPPFSDKAKFFAPRVFTGSIKYFVEKPCDEPSLMPSTKPTPAPTQHPTPSPTTVAPTPQSSVSPSLGPILTSVEFKFLFVVDFNEIDFVTIELHDVTEDVLEEFFNRGREGSTVMDRIINEGELYYDGVISIVSLDPEEYECDATDPNKACVGVECVVEISHNDKVSHLEVRYAMLSMKELIYPKLTFTNTKYIGPKPIETINTVQLSGVDYDAFNDQETIKYLEEAVREFLATVQDQADIASVTIVATNKVETVETSPYVRRFLQSVARSRTHISQDTSSVDLTIAVTGEYQPPPELKFDELTRESFDNEGDALVELLKKGENENLKRVTKVKAKIDPIGITPTDQGGISRPDVSKQDVEKQASKNTTIPIIVALSGVCIVSLFFVLLWGKKKNAAADDKEEEHRSSGNGRTIYGMVVDRTNRRGPDVLHSDPAFRHQQSGRL